MTHITNIMHTTHTTHTTRTTRTTRIMHTTRITNITNITHITKMTRITHITKRIGWLIVVATLLVPWIAASHQAEAAPQLPDRVGLRMLAVATEAEASDLRSQLEGGAIFDRLAIRYSLDPSALAGGYMGAFVISDLRPEFQNALEGLLPGELSPVAGVDGGYILFQLLTEEENSWMETRASGSQALQRGRYPEALELYEAAVDDAEGFGPNDHRLAESLMDLATVFHLGERYSEAVPLYGRSMAMLWSESAPDALADVTGMLEDLNEMLSFSFFRDDRFDQAKSEYEAAIREMPLTQDMYLAMSNMLSLAELEDEAKIVLLRAVEAFPDSRMARYELGEFYASSGQYADALEQFQAANTLDPNQAQDSPFARPPPSMLFARVGDTLDNLYRYDEAIEAYQRALELEPDGVGLRVSLAVAYLHQAEFESALAELELARSQDPDDASIHAGLADLYLRTSRFAESFEAAEMSLQLDPTQVETHYIAARALNRLGRREEGQAQMLLYQELGTDPESEESDVRVISRGAARLVVEGQEDRAILLFESLIETDPESAIARLNLGMAQRRLARHEDAIDTFQTMADLGLGDSMVHRALAIEHEALGNTMAHDEHQAMFLQIMDATLSQLSN